MVKVVVQGKLPKNSIIVEGFPSKGFVSTIAANCMIRELGMKPVGYIECEELSNIIIIRNSTPLRPMRIYAKDNIILIYSEVIVPFNSISKVSAAINSWLDKTKPKMVVLMAGITGKEAEVGVKHELMGVSSDKKLAETLHNSKVKLIKDGVLTGVSGNILMHCVDKKIPTIGLMVETEYSPDAYAAASMLEVLNKLLGIRIDVESLKKMGKDIEEEFKKILNQMKKGRERYVKMEETGHMYG